MKEYNPFGRQATQSYASKQAATGAEQGPYAHSASPASTSFPAQDSLGEAPHRLVQGETRPFQGRQRDEQSAATGQAQFPQFGDTKKSQTTQASALGLSELQKRIEAAKSNGWGAHFGKLIGKHRKKIVLLAVAVLLFAGGFYAYNKNDQNIPAFNLAIITESLSSDKTEFGDSNTLADSHTAPPLDLQLNENGEITIDDSGAPLFIQGNGSIITKTASAGDGITHLARGALKDYLEETGKSLTAEQKIYAEDYVQNKTGSEFLEVGQKLSFSKELLKDAVERAEALEDWQLQNLKQYTENVSLL